MSNVGDDGKGAAVDWWFVYKVPVNVGPDGDSTGYEFYYFDSNSSVSADGESLAAFTLDKEGSALEQTLAQVFGDDEDIGYVMWNDELPDGVAADEDFSYIYADDSSAYGHTKGILGFNKTAGTAFYLLHSTPQYPEYGDPLVPDGQNNNGQTFLCVTLTYAAANDLAETMRLNHRPQVYASSLPGVTSREPLYKLVHDSEFPTESRVPFAVDMMSAGGCHFRFFGKSGAWSEAKDDEEEGRDFWAELVGPSLRCDLNVETWRNGEPLTFDDEDNDPESGQDTGYDSLDTLRVDLGGIGIDGYAWDFTKDHAKWGIATTSEDGWIIVADLNRQTSQADRGGGGMAFRNADLWSLLSRIEVAEAEAVDEVHKDTAPEQDSGG